MTESLRVIEKFVKLPGVVEVKWLSDDPEFCRRPEDLFKVQDRGIPDSYGKKDKTTTVQAVFVCKLCECELKSIVTLRAHAKGTKHLRMECSMMREYISKSSGALKGNKLEKEEICADNLEIVLKRLPGPVVGVRYLEEIRSAGEKPPLYCCTLCQDFVADSRIICQHLLQRRHQIKYFERAYGYKWERMTKEDLLVNVRGEFEVLGVETKKIKIKTDEHLYRRLLEKRKRSVQGPILQSTGIGGKRSSASLEDTAAFSGKREDINEESEVLRMKLPRFVAEMNPQVDESIVDECELSKPSLSQEEREQDEKLLPNNFPSFVTKTHPRVDQTFARSHRDIEVDVHPSKKINSMSRELNASSQSSVNVGSMDDKTQVHLEVVHTPPASAPEPNLSTPVREPQDLVAAFHLDVAEWVKKCLNMYYYEKTGYERKIATPQDYGKLAKEFSYKFRKEEKSSCEARGCDVTGIKIDNDMKNRMKLQIDMHFEKLPPVD